MMIRPSAAVLPTYTTWDIPHYFPLSAQGGSELGVPFLTWSSLIPTEKVDQNPSQIIGRKIPTSKKLGEDFCSRIVSAVSTRESCTSALLAAALL